MSDCAKLIVVVRHLICIVNIRLKQVKCLKLINFFILGCEGCKIFVDNYSIHRDAISISVFIIFTIFSVEYELFHDPM